MSTETTETKKRTITLTGRQPVTIKDEDWPIIAQGDWSDHDNQYEFQANRKWSAWLRVRQHADGRAIAYGRYDYHTAFRNEADKRYRDGELLEAGADIPAAIQRVGRSLWDRSEDEHMRDVIAECIADLPAQEI